MLRLRTTGRELREKALRKAIARARIDLGLKNDLEAAQYFGESKSSYSRRMKDPLKSCGFDKVYETILKYRLTPNEVLGILELKIQEGK